MIVPTQASPEPAAQGGFDVRWRDAWKAALYAFVLSRALVVLSAALALAYAQQWTPGSLDEQTLRLFTPDTLAAIEARALSNDGGWYMEIAREGYEQRPFDASEQANWAFFPLHPMIWRAAMATGADPWPTAWVLANGFFLLALVQLHRWVQSVRGSEVATRTVLCVALFPTAYSFSLPLTESLFLFLLASSLLAMEQSRWGVATVFAALASGTRSVGVLLAPVLWLVSQRDPSMGVIRRSLYALAATTGLLVFMAMLWSASGNALAFADIQEAWGRDGGSLLKHFRRWASDPLLIAEAWNVRWINNASALFGLAGSVWLWRRGQRALAGFAFLCVMLPWSTGTLVSMGRYVLVCAPLFLALACWLAKPAHFLAWLLASAFGLAWMSSHFVLGASFAGA